MRVRKAKVLQGPLHLFIIYIYNIFILYRIYIPPPPTHSSSLEEREAERQRDRETERQRGRDTMSSGNQQTQDFFNGNAQDVESQQGQNSAKKKKNIFKQIQDTDTKTVTTYLRYANLCNAVCIITAGVVTLATLGSFNLTTMFIGLYIA